MYAKVINNEIVKYPYSLSDIYLDNPNVSFPSILNDEVLLSVGIEKVELVNAPELNYDENLEELLPEFINNKWQQKWTKIKKSNKEINEIVTVIRQESYRTESDPLFFKWQRDEATKEEWLAKVEEIKQRYPKV